MSTTGDNCLTLTQHGDPDHWDMVIEQAIQEVNEEFYDDLFDFFGKIDIDCGTDFPWYRIIYPKISNTARKHDSLLRVIGLQHVLLEEIENKSIDEIKAVQITDDIYKAAIVDVANQTGINTNISGERVSTHNLYSTIIAIILSLLTIVDQILAVIWGTLAQSDKDVSEIVVVPYPGRLSSIQPILDNFEKDFSVFTTHHWINWKFISKHAENSKYNKYNADPIQQHSSLAVICNQLSNIVQLSIETAYRRKLDRDLVVKIKKEYDIETSVTVPYLLNSIYKNRGFRDVQYSEIIKKITRDDRCSKFVCGGMSPRDRAMLDAVEQLGIRSYYIPHGAGNWYQFYPDTETMHIAFGKPEEKFFEQFKNKNQKAVIKVLGRPYLSDLITEYEGISENNESSSRINILVATQPFNDHIRKRFVKSIVDGIDRQENLEARVKIHPSEDGQFYQENTSNIPIVDEDLVGELKRADLVVTINSNVGLEAIVTGTPCICVNLWNAFTRAQYAEYGPIPVLRTEREIVEWFTGLDERKLESVKTTEVDYINSNYIYTDEVSKRIANHIESN